jgi:hypothetical protein
MDNKENEWYQRYFTKYPRIGGTLRRRKRAYYSEIVDDFKHLDGMSLSSIKRYELGTSDCPASVIFALASYYQCNIQELFDDDASFGRDIDMRKDNFRFSEISYRETPAGPSYTYAEELKGYRLDYGLKLNKGDYDLVTLEHDHQSLNLPIRAKLFFRVKDVRKEKWDELLNHEERIYFVTLETRSIETFPKKHKTKDGTVTFITKARVISDVSSSKMVMYQYDNKTKHITYQAFKRGIIGFAEKIIIDLV